MSPMLAQGLRRVLPALLLAGCQAHSFNATLAAGAGNGQMSSGTASPPTAADAASSSNEPAAGTSDPLGPTSVLVGCSVEEATRRARSAGYQGLIDVFTAREFIEACKPATVCAVTPRAFELVQGHGHLTLYLNRTLNISTPE